MDNAPVRIIYDGDCPVCAHYVTLARLRSSAGEVQLINAREDKPVRDEMTAQSLDLDDGMVVAMANRYYHGADAIHLLAMLGSRHNTFNRINHWIFSSHRRSRLCYPWLRALRNLLLKIRGASAINNLGRR